MEEEKDILKDKHNLMTVKMSDSVSIKKSKRGSRRNVPSDFKNIEIELEINNIENEYKILHL